MTSAIVVLKRGAGKVDYQRELREQGAGTVLIARDIPFQPDSAERVHPPAKSLNPTDTHFLGTNDFPDNCAVLRQVGNSNCLLAYGEDVTLPPQSLTPKTTLTLNGRVVKPMPSGPVDPNDAALHPALLLSDEPNRKWPLLNGSANTYMRVGLWSGPKTLGGPITPTLDMPIRVCARDGERASYEGPVQIDQGGVLVPPGGRLEFQRGQSTADVVQAFYLVSESVYTGAAGDQVPMRVLAQLTPPNSNKSRGRKNGGTTSDLGGCSKVSLDITRFPSHRTLESAGNLPVRRFAFLETSITPQGRSGESVNGFFITELTKDLTLASALSMTNAITHPNVQITLPSSTGSVTEHWIIYNYTAELHAFHIHQLHFTDTKTHVPEIAPNASENAVGISIRSELLPNPRLDGPLEVINVPYAVVKHLTALTGDPNATQSDDVFPGSVEMNITFTPDIHGNFVFHCHLLEHEDGGMMGSISVHLPNESNAGSMPAMNMTSHSPVKE